MPKLGKGGLLGQGVGKLATSPPRLSRAQTEANVNCVGSAYVHVNIEFSREKACLMVVRDFASCRSDDDDAQAPTHVARSLCLENHTIYRSGRLNRFLKVASPCLASW